VVTLNNVSLFFLTSNYISTCSTYNYEQSYVDVFKEIEKEKPLFIAFWINHNKSVSFTNSHQKSMQLMFNATFLFMLRLTRYGLSDFEENGSIIKNINYNLTNNASYALGYCSQRLIGRKRLKI
jgi:hypothetical protein